MKPNKRLIVVGGGAAGIFCAVNAARMNPGMSVTVLEKTGKLLSKVKVSGGGRCNVTHACFEISEMMKRYPRGGHFVRKAFHQWFTTNTIEWFEQRGVRLKTEADGRMFPVTDDSQTIIDCLMREVNAHRVEIRLHAEVKRVTRLDAEDGSEGGNRPSTGGSGFRIELGGDRLLEADYLCIASGGYHKSALFDWIRELGHTIEEPLPSLFTFNMPGNPITSLMGVSVSDAQLRIAGTKLQERGPLLVTHWGMSGPAVLKLSAWGARELAAGGYRFSAHVNWIPEFNEQGAREKLQSVRFEWAAQKVGTRNPFGLPARLWSFWLGICEITEDMRWADLPANKQNRLVSLLCAGEFAVNGKTTFKEEFVTAGGVRLNEVDPANMQSRKIPGLFFAGEVLDVDGVTGGFNFQHAWTSGYIAASAMAE